MRTHLGRVLDGLLKFVVPETVEVPTTFTGNDRAGVVAEACYVAGYRMAMKDVSDYLYEALHDRKI